MNNTTTAQNRGKGKGRRDWPEEKLVLKTNNGTTRTTIETVMNINSTTNMKTTTMSTSTTSSGSTTLPKASKTSKLKGRSSNLVQTGQKSILNYLELKSMETGTSKPKTNYTKVLCEPSSVFVDIDRGMTTEEQKVTQVMSSTAEGREDYSYFVIDERA